ncbi:MAG: hypothetical protein A3E83_01260 [Gammaproteobacteria bacterium RIFCSPHIGHO2_12_FULL_41_20]|nr:MAG: hypothetical protein A3E83_01260 [Gammaproteobacteria bacterium RIFCSPHIGHO2_12_FULL_41_20]
MNLLKHYWYIRRPLLHFTIWFYLANAGIFSILGLKYLTIIFSAKTLFSSAIYSYTTLFEKSLALLFYISAYLGNFTLLAVLPGIFLVIPSVIIFNKKFLTFSLATLLSTLSCITLLADEMVFSTYHFHINLTLLSIAFGEKYNVINFLELSTHEILWAMVIFIVVLLLQGCLVIFIWKKVVFKKPLFIARRWLSRLLALLAGSYMIFIITVSRDNNVFALQTPNLPLYNNILALLIPGKNTLALIERYSETRFSQPLFPALPLQYPLHPLKFSARKTLYNIVVIGIDAWRFDAINAQLTPHIEEFAKHAWRFQQHYSGGNSTQAGLFSLFYSLPSSYWASMLQKNQGAIVIHALLNHGYQTRVLYSSDISVPPIHKTIFYELRDLRPASQTGKSSAERDHIITKGFQEFLLHRDNNKPFFTFLFYNAAHAYCLPMSIPLLYPVDGSTCNRLTINHDSMSDYFNHYKNAVHFVDNEVGQVLTLLKEQRMLDNTIVIITSDHGEEFDDTRQAYWGHGSNYTDYQIRTPLIVYWPGEQPRMLTHRTSHYDIVPTLMQRVLGCVNDVSDYSVGRDLFVTKSRRYLLVGSYVNMSVVEEDKYTTLMTSGSIRVSNNQAMYLLDAKPDADIIAQALLDMRRYYLP